MLKQDHMHLLFIKIIQQEFSVVLCNKNAVIAQSHLYCGVKGLHWGVSVGWGWEGVTEHSSDEVVRSLTL